MLERRAKRAGQSATLLLVGTLALVACSQRSSPPSPRTFENETPRRPERRYLASVEQPPVKLPARLDWLLFGGGSEPLSNQVSLAQDLELMRSLLTGQGITLFASGPGAQLAIETHKQREAREPFREIARVLGVPGGEHTRYEPTSLPADGPSTTDQVLAALSRALEQDSDSPLFVYVASHGEQGEQPADNALSLWGGWGLKVSDVAQLLDREGKTRSTRFVITACYGGGFAELAFLGADPRKGTRSPEHCGLFAAPWDDEASGCDPNPDRRAQESYAIHFLHALAGKSRHGKALRSEIDLDNDGRVGLLEAHTYARIASHSFDMPTTTSERYLREVAPASEQQKLDPAVAREDARVVQVLGSELELEDERAARDKLYELERILDDAGRQVAAAQRQADDAYYALRIALLERWPLLEHPWESRTQRAITRERRAILHMLTESELAEAHRQTSRELDEALQDLDSVRMQRARVQRLVRAYETWRLASALRRKGGLTYLHYQALRRCEQWTPPLAARP